MTHSTVGSIVIFTLACDSVAAVVIIVAQHALCRINWQAIDADPYMTIALSPRRSRSWQGCSSTTRRMHVGDPPPLAAVSFARARDIAYARGRRLGGRAEMPAAGAVWVGAIMRGR